MRDAGCCEADALIKDGMRPCWAVDGEGTRCERYVAIAEGPQLCEGGHTTLGLATKGTAQPQTTSRLPITTARWIHYDAKCQRAIVAAVLHYHDGSEAVKRRLAKVKPVLKYGAQPLTQRLMVLTTHARLEMANEEISMPDLWRVVLEGKVLGRQPYGVVRVAGTDTKGRDVIVCYRLNVRHEIVVVTAFLDAQASVAA